MTLRLAVTGTNGQLVTALLERGAAAGVVVVPVGRPHLDLQLPETVLRALAAAEPSIIVSAAAYTAVDKAESEPEQAFAVNATGAGSVADAAARLGVPIIHISTDYVFDGTKATPYIETDATNPLGVYGVTKRDGERAVVAATANHAILRTAWVYSPFGNNFLKTMLRLAGDRDQVRVVADQQGNPTSALDLADAVLRVAHNLDASAASDLRGIFHVAGRGDTTWADFASEVFAASTHLGGPSALVVPIPSSDYPTPARRPANSRLDASSLARVHGHAMPNWQDSTASIVARLLDGQAPPSGRQIRK